MAVKIEFTGEGDPLLALLQKQRDLAAGANQQFEKLGATVKKQGEEGAKAQERLTQSVVASGAAVAALNDQAGKGFLSDLAKDIATATKNAQGFGTAMTTAGDMTEEAFASLVQSVKNQAKEQGVVVKAIDAGKKATLDAAVAARALTAQEAKLAQEAIEVLDAFKAQQQAASGATEGVKKTDAAAKSLRTQLKEAREELARLEEASDGRITPELVQAAQRAGELQDRLGDVNATIQAFNPDAKFQAFGQVIQAGSGALTAFQGALGLVGVESDNVGKALLKVQSALAITQGLQAFFGGFRDGIRNARAVLLSLTAAQRASTAATVVDTEAKTAQTAATVAGTTATGGLTAALNALKVAALSNPFTAILVGIGALIGLMLAFKSSTENATESYQELLDKIQKGFDRRNLQLDITNAQRLIKLEEDRLRRIEAVNEGKRASSEQTREEAERDAILQEAIDTETTLNILANIDKREQALRRLSELVNKGFARDASDKERENALVGLGLPDDATLQDAQNKFKEFNDELVRDKAQADVQIAAIEQKSIQGRADRLAQEQKQREDQLRETKEFNDNLLRELDRLNTEVEARLQRARIASANPVDRIQLEQDAALKEIDVIQQNIQRKMALLELERTLGVAAIKRLSEEQQNARADALIAEGNIRLSPEQIANLNALRYEAERQGQKQLSELLVSEANARIEIIANAQDREQATFEAGLTAKVDALRRARVDEVAIESFIDQQRAQFTAERKAKAIAAEEEIALAQIDTQIANASEDERLRFQLELKKLDIQEQFARIRLAAVVDDGSKEAAALKAGLEKQLAEIEAARRGLQQNAPKFSLLGLLGIKEEDQAAVRASLQGLLGSVQSILSQTIAAQEAELQSRTQTTDAIIADAQRRQSELERTLEQERQKQQDGLANNVESTQRALEAIKGEQQKALEEKRRIAEEEKKIAKQRAVIEAATQAQSLLTAGATLFSEEVRRGGVVGVFAAIAGIAAMVSAFIGLKASVSKFREGGVHMLNGPSHEGGGLAVIDRRTGQVQAEAEGGEAAIGFVRREHAKKAMPMLEAINANDMQKLHRLAAKEIGKLASSTGIYLEPEEKVQEFTQVREAIVVHNTVVQQSHNEELKREIRELRNELVSFKEQEEARPEITTLPSGNVRVRHKKKGQVVKEEIIKKKKRNG